MKKYKKKCVFNGKGTMGKTPFSLEMSLWHDIAYATNELRDREEIKALFPEDAFLQVEPGEEFPQLSKDFEVIFDLGGNVVGYKKSILSALKQSDLIIIPTVNQKEALRETAYSIADIKENSDISADILLIANMLENHAGGDFTKGKDFLAIEKELQKQLKDDFDFPVLPLKKSKGFENIVKKGIPIREMVNRGGLDRSNYQILANQLDQISNFIQQ